MQSPEPLLAHMCRRRELDFAYIGSELELWKKGSHRLSLGMQSTVQDHVRRGGGGVLGGGGQGEDNGGYKGGLDYHPIKIVANCRLCAKKICLGHQEGDHTPPLSCRHRSQLQ